MGNMHLKGYCQLIRNNNNNNNNNNNDNDNDNDNNNNNNNVWYLPEFNLEDRNAQIRQWFGTMG